MIVVTRVRTSDGDTDDFSIRIGLHQRSALSHYLFALVMDEVTRDIKGTSLVKASRPLIRFRRLMTIQDYYD